MALLPDVTTLSQKEASDYRQELIRALHHPGLEFDMDDKTTEAAYKSQLEKVDAYLQTFDIKI